MLLQDAFINSAHRLPDKTALICDDKRLTYRDVDHLTNAFSNYLIAIGVERQDRIAVFLDNSVESVVSLYGILKSDAIFVIINPTVKSGKLSYLLNHCQIKTIITSPKTKNIILETLPHALTLKNIIWTGDIPRESNVGQADIFHHSWGRAIDGYQCCETLPLTANISLDLAAIIYTSGSTGNPKGVMLTHHNMISAANSIITYLENREDDIVINVLPLSFDYGLYQVLMTFTFGGTLVLLKSFAFPYRVVEKMAEEKVTGFPGLPTIFAILLKMEKLDTFDFSNLRYISSTGDVLTPAFINKLRAIFPGAHLYSMYGLTECKRVSYLPPKAIIRKPQSVGVAIPDTEVWVADKSGKEVERGTVGELMIRGPHVMAGYWGDQEGTDRILKPGKYPGARVLCSGDLFRMDDEGFLFFIGRKDNVLKCRGHLVSPLEIESCILSMDQVIEAAVIGIPDDVLGKAIIAFVRIEEQRLISEKQILGHCKLHLEDYMVPQIVKIVSSFPKTSSTKIDKKAMLNAYVYSTRKSSDMVQMPS